MGLKRRIVGGVEEEGCGWGLEGISMDGGLRQSERVLIDFVGEKQ